MAPKSSFETLGISDAALCPEPRVDTKAYDSSKPIKSVTFRPTVGVRTCIHLNDYTEDEVQATWYDKVDLAVIKLDVKATLTKMIQGDFTEDDICSSRGLESYTPEGAIRKRLHKNNTWNVVLDEQDAQRDQGINDPELIADLCHEQTAQSQVEANMIALRDAEFACDKNLSQGKSSHTFKTHPSAKMGMIVRPQRLRQVSSSAA